MPCLLPLGPREQHFKADPATAVAMATLGESSRNTELFPETTTYLGHLPNCTFDLKYTSSVYRHNSFFKNTR